MKGGYSSTSSRKSTCPCARGLRNRGDGHAKASQVPNRSNAISKTGDTSSTSHPSEQRARPDAGRVHREVSLVTRPLLPCVPARLWRSLITICSTPFGSGKVTGQTRADLSSVTRLFSSLLLCACPSLTDSLRSPPSSAAAQHTLVLASDLSNLSESLRFLSAARPSSPPHRFKLYAATSRRR